MVFLTCSLRFLISKKLKQSEFKLEKNIEIQKHRGKVRKRDIFVCKLNYITLDSMLLCMFLRKFETGKINENLKTLDKITIFVMLTLCNGSHFCRQKAKKGLSFCQHDNKKLLVYQRRLSREIYFNCPCQTLSYFKVLFW